MVRQGRQEVVCGLYSRRVILPVMSPRERLAKGEKKTSVWLPGDVWMAAKVRALEERVDLREVIVRALAGYLATTKKGRRT